MVLVPQFWEQILAVTGIGAPGQRLHQPFWKRGGR